MAKGKFSWGPGNSARKCNKVAAYHKESRFAVARQAEELAIRAKRKLGAHTRSGDAQITVSHGKLDWFVSLDDSRGQRAAAAIEFGHRDPDSGTFVEGIHALTSGTRS
ncbi:MAG TPA: DUF5403 family protein [Pseudonocardia sp.]|uniref:DUF5403 family protein n=1 Tax=Pseudonocardia sp. TaxID=60912 RepID=UPI002CFD107E|nr:DUF5403 family protein [Pseudonocardia sp.]HTF54486.1 DUF5403 family protein [Pseudonocardia sp.]